MSDKQKRFEYLQKKHEKYLNESYFLGECPKYRAKHNLELIELWLLQDKLNIEKATQDYKDVYGEGQL